MKTRLYVGNVPYDFCSEEGLRELFDGFDVKEVHVVADKDNGGRPKGFCFVEMATEAEAERAIAELHESSFHGRSINVRHAHAKPERKGGGRRRDRDQDDGWNRN